MIAQVFLDLEPYATHFFEWLDAKLGWFSGRVKAVGWTQAFKEALDNVTKTIDDWAKSVDWGSIGSEWGERLGAALGAAFKTAMHNMLFGKTAEGQPSFLGLSLEPGGFLDKTLKFLNQPGIIHSEILGSPATPRQHGGIIGAGGEYSRLHEGEMVLPPSLSTGLQMMVANRGNDPFSPNSRSSVATLDWLQGETVPKVEIAKVALDVINQGWGGGGGGLVSGGAAEATAAAVANSAASGGAPGPGGPVGEVTGTTSKLNATQAAWLQTVIPLAKKASEQTGIDPRLILAQAAVESGWGQHPQAGQNVFGIKGGPGGGYAHHATVEESFDAYVNLMKGQRYAGVRAGQGLEAQIQALGGSGYNEAPGQYMQQLRTVASTFNALAPGGAVPKTISSIPGRADISLGAGVNKQLTAAAEQAMSEILPEGYHARLTSGFRPGDPGAHGLGLAEDWQIFGPGNKAISNRGEDTSGLYRQWAIATRAHLMLTNPELAAMFSWGGHFGTEKGGGGVEDLMHIDVWNPRGRRHGGQQAEYQEAMAYYQRLTAGGGTSAMMADARRATQGRMGLPHEGQGRTIGPVPEPNTTVVVNQFAEDPRVASGRYAQARRRHYGDMQRNLQTRAA
jgi:hypothetical protein